MICMSMKHTEVMYRRILEALPAAIEKKLPREVSVIEITADTSRVLNLRFRNKRKPTNVLSFRYGPEYGEILLTAAVIKKEAKKFGYSQVFQMTWMILHGMLHLAGLHHERSASQAKKTERIETRVLVMLFPKGRDGK